MDLKELQKKVIEFRDARDWGQMKQMARWEVDETPGKDV
jgi:hypothetical protein